MTFYGIFRPLYSKNCKSYQILTKCSHKFRKGEERIFEICLIFDQNKGEGRILGEGRIKG